MEKRVITVTYNRKGYSTVSFAALFGITLSLEGYKVLLVDLNPYRNLSKCFGWNGEGYTIKDIFEGSTDIDVHKFSIDELSYIPAETGALNAINEMLKLSDDNPLKGFIDKLDGFDKIIFDCLPVGSNIVTEKAAELSGNVIVSPSNVSPNLKYMINAVDKELKELCYMIKADRERRKIDVKY